jgi:catechol 2,3-dioxygenase-like lactoylglutathione lyase family enzyme
MSEPFPADSELTHILVVAHADRSRDLYRDVLGAKVLPEYGGTSVVMSVAGTWLLLVTGGEPTPDKPALTFAPPEGDRISHAMTFRVADCGQTYATLSSRGAVFLTPPIDNGPEIRCFFRDPDGHLIEFSQAQ